MKRVLILEDDPVFAECLRASLEEDGYEVVLCATATEALSVLEKVPVSAVLADIFIKSSAGLMRDGGVRLISQLKQIQNLAVPVIAMSGSFEHSGGDQIQQTAKVVGARATLAKPFHPEDLLNLLYGLINPRQDAPDTAPVKPPEKLA